MAARRGRVLLVATATLVAVAVAEVGVRMAFPALAPRTGQPEIVDVQSSPPLFRLRPGSTFRHVWPTDASGPGTLELDYQIDRLGFRSGAALGQPTRLVVLGDSFVFGEGVPIAARLTERLEIAGVYNAGVPGWSTLDEVAALPGLVAALGPRAVLIVAQPNDAVPITHAQQRDGGDLLALGGGQSPLRVLSLLTAATRTAQTEDWYRSYWVGERREFGDRVGAALRAAAAACAEHGVQLGVAAFPLLHELDDYPFRGVHAALAADAERAGVPFHDLLPAFEGRESSKLWVHASDHHPNPTAHELAAESLRPFVRSLLR